MGRTKKQILANIELEADAKAARESGCNYGQMKAREYRQRHTGEIKETIAYMRREHGYLSMRERAALQGKTL